jgi:hypothetical protein
MYIRVKLLPMKQDQATLTCKLREAECFQPLLWAFIHCSSKPCEALSIVPFRALKGMALSETIFTLFRRVIGRELNVFIHKRF